MTESLQQQFSIGFNIAIHLGARYDEEVKQWVSWCPALKLYSQGDTEEQAIENIHETVSLFPGTCYELGTLNRVLHECGFRRGCGVQDDPYTIPLSVSDGERSKYAEATASQLS